jgi:hypothetical protein
LGVQHKFETYDGDQGSWMKIRFAENLLPFFTANLAAAK